MRLKASPHGPEMAVTWMFWMERSCSRERWSALGLVVPFESGCWISWLMKMLGMVARRRTEGL